MRMIYNVIDRILPLIPEDIPQPNGVTYGYVDLREKLKQVRENSLYKAPEQMPEYFQAVANLLNHHLGKPDTEWKQKIVNIFADKE